MKILDLIEPSSLAEKKAALNEKNKISGKDAESSQELDLALRLISLIKQNLSR